MNKRSLAILLAAILLALPAVARAAEFGLKPGSTTVSALNLDNTVDEQASSHPGSFVVHLELNAKEDGSSEGGVMRSAIADLPPGLAGNLREMPTCTRQEFDGGGADCAPETQVGVLRAIVEGLGEIVRPVYNLQPPPSYVAQLGTNELGFEALQYVTVRSDEGYGVQVTTPNLPVGVTVATETIWGTPADKSHNPERGSPALNGQGPPLASSAPKIPFLTLPAQCSSPLALTVRVNSKENPGVFSEETAYTSDAGGNPVALSGCEAVPFAPQIAASPSTGQASSPSGLDFTLSLPNKGLRAPGGIAETEPEKMEIALPEGFVANPASAEGMAACSEAQYEAEQVGAAAGTGCPAASKVGSLEAHSPLLEEAVKGSLYLAQPYLNPAHSFIALYLVAAAPERGVMIKQVVKVEPDPDTGRLVSTIEGMPPLPYSDATLHLRQGPRALLVTPSTCGTYTATAKLYPFSAPEASVQRSASLQVDSGPEGGPCPSGTPPFAPGFEAGTLSNSAGAHSPFYMRLTRKQGEQELTKLSTALPPGLLASLVGVGKCSDAEIAQAASRTGPAGGAEELADPSCPASSQIGHTLAGAGAGGLTFVPGNLYLAGPYKGAPLSVAAIVPGLAGPFDVGTIVVRLALRFNPLTARAEVDGSSSDPLPRILRGIPLDVRDVRAYTDRPGWTFNPTNCEPMSTQASVWGLAPVSLAARFQAADCANLGFKPALKLSLKGGTKRGGFPQLTGTYTPRPGDSNLRGLVVRLPHSEFIEQGHFRTICTRVQYAAGAGFGSECPEGSVYGWARATTPLLEETLEGPVYLRASPGHKLPALVGALHGIVDVEAEAQIDSQNGGLRATFENLPDAPVSRVVVQMQGGKKGLIVNSTDLCAAKHHVNVNYAAQSGRRAEGKPELRASSCKKHARKGRARG